MATLCHKETADVVEGLMQPSPVQLNSLSINRVQASKAHGTLEEEMVHQGLVTGQSDFFTHSKCSFYLKYRCSNVKSRRKLQLLFIHKFFFIPNRNGIKPKS